MKGWITLNNQKCHECRYEYTCVGVPNEVRTACQEFKPKGHSYEPYSAKWSEMSYYKERQAASRTMQERLRYGE